MTEETIFANALSKADLDQRKAYLDDACAGNPSLRHEIEALLQAHEKADGFLTRPAAEQLAAGRAQTDAATEALERNAGGDEIGEENALAFLQPSTKPGSLGRLGHYEVLEVLGRGGFGIVLKAFDELLHRVVAIKVMSTQLAATSPARKRFLREARASAKVRHENVVAIYAVEEQPIPYLVMEYIAGETLQQRLDRVGPFDTPEVLRLGRQIAAGLAAAHAMGLIHRDIKPSNILLENGVEQHVKITDFGLARAADDASLTQSGFIAGTPMYMAPEQAEGKVIDQRADLFSLGSVLYVMCSGRPPFRASTTMAVLKRVTEDTPRPIREIIPEVPEWLCAIVAKLHAKNPAERFQSAKEVTDLLSQHLAHLQQPALVPPPASIFSANREQPPAHRAEQVKPVVRFGNLFPRTRRMRVLLGLLGFLLLVVILMQLAVIIAQITSWLTRDKEPPYTSGVSNSAPPLAKAPFSAAEARQHQEAWAKYLGAPVENTNSAGTTMILVPPGEFLMGMTDEEVAAALKDKAPGHWLYNNYRESRPQHKVTISKPFYMAATEVTVAQFRAFVTDTGYRTEAERDGMGGTRWDEQQKKLVQEKNLLWETPGYAVSRDMPVTQITWNDAVAYCNWLSKREALSRRYEETRESWEPVSGDGYSLPTEAEWEYACKAGTTTLYSCGNDEETLGKYAWYCRNSDGRPHSVGTKLANAFGLFDMHGNASEFCQDFYSGNYYAPLAATDPRGPEVSRSHVRRGGHWDADADAAPSALRMSLFVHDRQRSTGFRVVRELPGVAVRKSDASEPHPAVAPFVILSKDAKAERSFATLKDAVDKATSGDTIEIRSDGPFRIAPIEITKALTIRAGAGYRPVLVHTTDGWLLYTTAPLALVALEGLEFHSFGNNQKPNQHQWALIGAYATSLRITHCRIVMDGRLTAIWSWNSPLLEVKDSEVFSSASGIEIGAMNRGRYVIQNCCLGRSLPLALFESDRPLPKPARDAEVELIDNTFIADRKIWANRFFRDPLDSAKEDFRSVRFKAVGNVFQSRLRFGVVEDWDGDRPFRPDAFADWYRTHVAWEARDNLFAVPGNFLVLTEFDDGRRQELTWKTSKDWQTFWKIDKAPGMEGSPRFTGGDLLARPEKDLLGLTGADFRLEKGSPGQGADSDGKDLGADVDLVGPGAAYEKWKKTPEYQEWRKKTDELLEKAK